MVERLFDVEKATGSIPVPPTIPKNLDSTKPPAKVVLRFLVQLGNLWYHTNVDTKSLQKFLDIKFKNPDLLLSAVTHRSYLNENRAFDLPHNERLEFLGDAVLELVATEYLYLNYPHPEGELTNFRSALVNYRMLSDIARRLHVEDFLQMSRGEAKDVGRARQVILANAMEAVIGAIYLDRGYDVARDFIMREVMVELPGIINAGAYVDPRASCRKLCRTSWA